MCDTVMEGRESSSNLSFNCDDQSSITWMQRADLCVELISAFGISPDQNISLADIGCGDQKLRAAIAKRGYRCRYSGFDLLPQHPDVRMFDVERDVLPSGHDLAVILGVIEYLEQPGRVFRTLAQCVPRMIISHVIRQDNYYSDDRLEKLKWRNHFSESEMTHTLNTNGFAVVHQAMAPDQRTLLFACRSMMSPKN